MSDAERALVELGKRITSDVLAITKGTAFGADAPVLEAVLAGVAAMITQALDDHNWEEH